MITLDEIRNNTKLQEYKRMVIETNEVLNLTAITDSFEFDVKHLYDSLLISDYFDYPITKRRRSTKRRKCRKIAPSPKRRRSTER